MLLSKSCPRGSRRPHPERSSHAGDVPIPRILVRRHELIAESGVLSIELTPGGPAEKAGVQRGDVIIELGGQPIRSIDDLHRLLTGEQVDSKLALKILRGNRLETLTVIPVESIPA